MSIFSCIVSMSALQYVFLNLYFFIFIDTQLSHLPKQINSNDISKSGSVKNLPKPFAHECLKI